MKALIVLAAAFASFDAGAQIQSVETERLLMLHRALATEAMLLERKSSAREPAENRRLAELRKQLDEIQKAIDGQKRPQQ